MNDIPAFTECGGVSTLILREVPYKKIAFIVVRAFDSRSLNEHLQEAVSLCRFAGAKAVFATAENEKLFPEKEPDYNMLRFSADCSFDHCTCTELTWDELSENNMQEYIGIYNTCFADILSAETFAEKKARTCMGTRGRQCRIYYKEGVPAAISDVEIADDIAMLNAVAVLPEYRGGCGEAILKNLMAETASKGIRKLCVNVMSTNLRALKLYEKLGFKPEEELSFWYRLL